MSTRTVLGDENLAEKELRNYEIGQRNILVTKVNGEIKALDDWCNHAGCLLSGGWIEGNMVVCACHEIGFDLDTGANVTSPGMCDDQPTMKVVVEGGKLILEDE